MNAVSQPHGASPTTEPTPFEPKALLHRHGGRIASLLRIEHVTEGGRATWFFVGTVAWFEGTNTGQEVDISPTSLVTDDDAGKVEWDLAMDALSAYLIEHGQWGEQGHWKPNVPFGSAPVAIAPR